MAQTYLNSIKTCHCFGNFTIHQGFQLVKLSINNLSLETSLGQKYINYSELNQVYQNFPSLSHFRIIDNEGGGC